MPYILPLDRNRLLQETLADAQGLSPGELNYQFTELINNYLAGFHSVGYTELNEVIGALECCKLELYRRLVAPYEDEKIAENGDVY